MGRRDDLDDAQRRGLSRTRIAASMRWHVGSYLAADLRSLSVTIREERCSALLCQDYENPQFDIATLVARWCNLPIFATFQSGVQLSRFEGPLRRRAVRACAGLIIPAEIEVERVRARYGISSEKLAHISNPVDVAGWRGGDQLSARAMLGLPIGAKVVVYHGRIEMHYKGVDVLLSAWQALCGSRPEQDLRLILVGSGSDANKLRRLLGSGRFHGVHWTDRHFTRRSELRPFLTAADVYAFAGRYEGQPVALLEAMACGLPIVSTAASGVPDLLGDRTEARGITVPIDDAPALAQRIGQLLDCPRLRHELGSRARQWAESRYDTTIVGEQIRDFMVSRGLSWVDTPGADSR